MKQVLHKLKGLALMLVLIITASDTMATVSVTASLTNTSISADNAANSTNPSGGAFVTVGPLTITEGNPADFAVTSAKYFTLTAPSGWVFNTSATITVTATGTVNLTGLSGTFVAGVLRINYTAPTNSNFFTNTITVTGIQVQASLGNTIPQTGSILAGTGTSSITGINGLNCGNLGLVAGAPILTISAIPDPETAGVAFSATITGADQFGHASAGTVTMSTNAGTISPATVTMTAGTTGAQNFTVTQAGTLKNITATLSGVSKTSNNFTVNVGAVSKFTVVVTGAQVSGAPFNAVITAQDAGGNTVTSYIGTPALTANNSFLISPTTTNVAFVNGVTTQPVTLTGNGAAVAVTATDGAATGSSTSFVTSATWYSGSAANINLASAASWNSNPDGTSGNALPNASMFNAGYGTFRVQNTSTATISSAWTVSTTGTGKVVVGDGANATTFTIPTTSVFTGTVDVSNLSKLTMQNTTQPTLGTLGTTSTVEYAMTGTPTIVTKAYGYLTITNGGTKTISTTPITVANDLTINSGATLTFNDNAGDALTVSGNVIVPGSFTVTNQTGGTFAHSLQIGGDLTVAGTFNMTSSDDYCAVTFSSAALQTISGAGTITFYNLINSNTNGGLTVARNIAVNGAVNGSAITLNNSSLLTINNGITVSASTGAVGVHSTGSASTSASIAGSGTMSATALNIGDAATTPTAVFTHTLNFDGITLNISGALTINGYRNGSNVRVDNGTLNLNSGIISVGGTVTTANSGTGNVAILNMASGLQTGTLNVGGGTTAFVISANGTSTITLGGTGSTVNYTRNNTQTIYAPSANYPYFNLTTSGGAGTKTLGNSIIANGKITIGTGTTLASGNFAINAKGDWENNNAFTAGTAAVTFGGAALQNIAGGSTTTFNNLIISNAAGVKLGIAQIVAGAVSFTSGKLDASQFGLTLNTAVANVTGASATSYIITGNGFGSGKLTENGMASGTAYKFPIGSVNYYLPVTITPTTAALNWSAFVFEGATTNGAYGGPLFSDVSGIVNAIWDVTPSVLATTATLKLDFSAPGAATALEGARLAAWPPTQEKLGISHYTTPGPAWQTAINNGGPGNNNATHTATANFTSFSPFAIGSIDVPLPVTLSQFDATLNSDNTTNITWTTDIEINSAYFNVLRSTNGVDYTSIGSVTSHGNSSVQNHYQFTDQIPVTGVTYYRLQMVDLDGSSKYSEIKVVRPSAVTSISIFPNPARNFVNVSLGMNISKNLVIRLISQNGQLLQQKTVTNGAGTTISIPVSQYAEGMYLLQLVSGDGSSETHKIIIGKQ